MIKEIIQKFKNFLFNTDYYKKTEEEINKEKYFKEEILPNYNFGDIIWALRYDFDWDKEEINETHEIGPYIVLGKTDKKLVCMYCTSVPDKKYFFEIGENKIHNLKKTYTSIYNVRAIDAESFVGENINGEKSLSEEDKELIAKKFSNNNMVHYDDLGIKKVLKFKLDIKPRLAPGDIIKENGSYYYKLVLKRDSKYIYTISIKYYDRSTNNINFSRENFIFNIKQEEANNNDIYINTLSSTQFKIVQDKYNDYLKLIKEKKELKENCGLKRGALISRHYNTYYVYNIEKDKAKIFSLTRKHHEDVDTIKIGGTIYTPNYEDEQEVDIKNDTYNLIKLANEKEMDNISSNRKSYYKTKKEVLLKQKEQLKKKNKKEFINEFSIGDIIKCEYLFGMDFIVIGIAYNKIITVSLHALEEGRVIYREFNLKDKTLSKCAFITDEVKKYIEEKYEYLNSLGEQVIEAKRLRYEKQ